MALSLLRLSELAVAALVNVPGSCADQDLITMLAADACQTPAEQHLAKIPSGCRTPSLHKSMAYEEYREYGTRGGGPGGGPVLEPRLLVDPARSPVRKMGWGGGGKAKGGKDHAPVQKQFLKAPIIRPATVRATPVTWSAQAARSGSGPPAGHRPVVVKPMVRTPSAIRAGLLAGGGGAKGKGPAAFAVSKGQTKGPPKGVGKAASAEASWAKGGKDRGDKGSVWVPGKGAKGDKGKGKFKGKGKKGAPPAPPADDEFWQVKMAQENRQLLLLPLCCITALARTCRCRRSFVFVPPLRRPPGAEDRLRRFSACPPMVGRCFFSLQLLLLNVQAQDQQLGPPVDFSVDFPLEQTEERLLNVVYGTFLLDAELGLETNFEDIDRVVKATIGSICQYSPVQSAPVVVARFLDACLQRLLASSVPLAKDMQSLAFRRKTFRFEWSLLPQQSHPLPGDCMSMLAQMSFGPSVPPYEEVGRSPPAIRRVFAMELASFANTRALDSSYWGLTLGNVSCLPARVTRALLESFTTGTTTTPLPTHVCDGRMYATGGGEDSGFDPTMVSDCSVAQQEKIPHVRLCTCLQ
eukprot:s1909_g3.t1